MEKYDSMENESRNVERLMNTAMNRNAEAFNYTRLSQCKG